jgi:lipoprotein-releasing system ATP-binding protein
VRGLKGIDLAIPLQPPPPWWGFWCRKKYFIAYTGGIGRPNSGTVTYEGQGPFASKSDRELADFRSTTIGFVFQFHHLLPEFTALENVLMPALIARRSYRPSDQRARMLPG